MHSWRAAVPSPRQTHTLRSLSLLTDDICGEIYCCLILLQAERARVDLLLQNGAEEARQQETLPFPLGWSIAWSARASPATHYGRDMIYCIYRDVCAAPKSLFLRAFAQKTLSTACQFLQRCRKFASWNQNLNEVAPGSRISSGCLLLEWMKREQSMQPARHVCKTGLYNLLVLQNLYMSTILIILWRSTDATSIKS